MPYSMHRARFLKLLLGAGASLSAADLLAACGGDDRPEEAGGQPGATLPSEIRIGVFAGDLAEVQRKVWVPAIESEYNTRVVLDDTFVSSKALAALQAARGDPSLTLVVMDQPVLSEAKSLDLLAPIDRDQLSHISSIPEAMLVEGGYGLGFGLMYMSIIYNADVVDEPDTWLDLLEPEFTGKVVIPSGALTSSIYLLILSGLAVMGRAVPTEGSIDDMGDVIENGFEFLGQLKPQIAAISSDDIATFSRLAGGQSIACVAPSLSKYGAPYTARDINLRVAFPREGVFIYGNTMVIPKGAPGEAEASGVLDSLIAPEYQSAQAEEAFVGPVNTEVQVSEEEISLTPAAGALPEGAAMFATLDFDFIREHKSEWERRFEEILA